MGRLTTRRSHGRVEVGKNAHGAIADLGLAHIRRIPAVATDFRVVDVVAGPFCFCLATYAIRIPCAAVIDDVLEKVAWVAHAHRHHLVAVGDGVGDTGIYSLFLLPIAPQKKETHKKRTNYLLIGNRIFYSQSVRRATFELESAIILFWDHSFLPRNAENTKNTTVFGELVRLVPCAQLKRAMRWSWTTHYDPHEQSSLNLTWRTIIISSGRLLHMITARRETRDEKEGT